MSHISHAPEELQALFDAAVDAIIMIDHLGTIRSLNRSAELLFGYAATEAVGRNISLFMPTEQAALHDGHLQRYVATRAPNVIGTGRDVIARRKDGSEFPARLSVGLVPNSEPPRFVGFVHDLTQRREIEADGRRAEARLAQVARYAALGEMAAGIAHELNQPLSAIATYAQACDRMLGAPAPDMPEIRNALKQVTAQALRAGEIIRKLRHLVGNREIERIDSDLNAVVEELITLAGTDLRNHHATLDFALTPALAAVSIDRVQVQQVLLNLLRNAMEALDDASGAEREIVIGTRAVDDDEVEVYVRDRGHGVPTDVAQRMFDPFFTTKRSGTGLGLAISKTIARAHRGTLGHRSHALSGTEFFLRLPTLEKNSQQ
jgi:two-component system sensor kinase FixL